MMQISVPHFMRKDKKHSIEILVFHICQVHDLRVQLDEDPARDPAGEGVQLSVHLLDIDLGHDRKIHELRELPNLPVDLRKVLFGHPDAVGKLLRVDGVDRSNVGHKHEDDGGDPSDDPCQDEEDYQPSGVIRAALLQTEKAEKVFQLRDHVKIVGKKEYHKTGGDQSGQDADGIKQQFAPVPGPADLLPDQGAAVLIHVLIHVFHSFFSRSFPVSILKESLFF